MPARPARSGIIAVAVAILVLALVTLSLLLIDVRVDRDYSAYASLGFESVSAIEVVVPEGASNPTLRIIATAQNKSSSNIILVVAGSTGVIANASISPGSVITRELALPGPGKYRIIMIPETFKAEGAVRAQLEYGVPALYTEASSILGPAGVIAGFLAGWGLSRQTNTGNGGRINTLEKAQGEAGEGEG